MASFASRDLSFVSLAELGAADTTGNTQQCEKASGATACTCCTNNTEEVKSKASDSDLAGLQRQLLTTAD